MCTIPLSLAKPGEAMPGPYSSLLVLRRRASRGAVSNGRFGRKTQDNADPALTRLFISNKDSRTRAVRRVRLSGANPSVSCVHAKSCLLSDAHLPNQSWRRVEAGTQVHRRVGGPVFLLLLLLLRPSARRLPCQNERRREKTVSGFGALCPLAPAAGGGLGARAAGRLGHGDEHITSCCPGISRPWPARQRSVAVAPGYFHALCSLSLSPRRRTRYTRDVQSLAHWLGALGALGMECSH